MENNFYTHNVMFHDYMKHESHVVLLSLHLQSHEICFTNVLSSFIVVIILNILRFAFFVSLRTYIFVNKSSTALKLPLHLSTLSMNG